MNSHEPDILLQSFLDRHAAGESAASLLAELRAQPGGAGPAADLGLALALAAQLPATMRPARRATMQAELQAAFTAERGSRRHGLVAWLTPAKGRRLALRLGGVMLAGALAMGGGVVVSAESLPGDAFYPVKRAAETARLAFTWSPEARARLWLDLSDIRHDEVKDLDQQGRQAPTSLMDAWLTAHQQARQEALESGDPQLIELVEQRVEAHAHDLEGLPQQPSPDAIEQLRAQPTAGPTDPVDAAPPEVATASPTPEPPTATPAGGGPAGRGPGGRGGRDPRPTPEQGRTPWPPVPPRDRWRTATVPPATVEAWATERAARRQTEEPRRHDEPTRDPARRATDDARRATERARRATEQAPLRPQDTPVPPTAAPGGERTPVIGPTNGPPPGPPRPTPDPSRQPGRRCPPDCPPWTPRPPRPGEPPTVAPDPTEEPLPTSLGGVVATEPPPTPEQAVRP